MYARVISSLALALDVSPREGVATAQAIGRLGDLDHARDTRRFHPTGEIDRIAPDVVAELPMADDAGHGRAGGDADADSERHDG